MEQILVVLIGFVIGWMLGEIQSRIKRKRARNFEKRLELLDLIYSKPNLIVENYMRLARECPQQEETEDVEP